MKSNPGAAEDRVNIQRRETFSFLSASWARVSQASAISSNACRSFPLIWLAIRMQSAAYFLNFSDSRNPASSVPAKETPVFGTLFANNFVKQICAEPMDPALTFTAACRGGLVAVFFRRRLSSICRGMREIGATSRRSGRQGTAVGHGRDLPGARRQKRRQVFRLTRRLTDRPCSGGARLHLRGTGEAATGFLGVVGQRP